MSAVAVVEILLGDPRCAGAKGLIEASVHRPARGKRWIASFRNQEGQQQWKSTGLTDRSAALILAKEWEAAATRLCMAAAAEGFDSCGGRNRQGDTGLITQREVALLMKISERAVRNIERRAIDKLRRNPTLKQLWREWSRGDIEEEFVPRGDWNLTPDEIATVYALAQSPAER